MLDIQVVRSGRELRSLAIMLVTARWWIVTIKCTGDPLGGVYIGPGHVVARWIEFHRATFGCIRELNIHPFDDREQFLGSVRKTEEEFYAMNQQHTEFEAEMENALRAFDSDNVIREKEHDGVEAEDRDRRRARKREKHHRPGAEVRPGQHGSGAGARH